MSFKIFIFLITIVSIFTISACASTKAVDKDEPWSFELVLGGCMDVCPAYSITIQSNGNYAYIGKFMVKHKGRKTGQINDQRLVEFKKIITDIEWNILKSIYDKPGHGSERKSMKYSSKSINKEITYSQFEPQELRTLENFINTLINQNEF